MRVIHGDCLELFPAVKSASVKLIIADPPYGNVIAEKWDKTSLADYCQFTKQWLDECRRVLTDDGSIYVWASIGKRSYQMWIALAQLLTERFTLQDIIVWSKQRGRGNRRGWLSTREEILWASKGENYVWNKQYSNHKYADCWIKRLAKQDTPYKRATNIWTDIDEVSIEQAKESGCRGKRETLHPTQKPVAAIKRIILAHTGAGDIVLDPFAGSGTTGIACLDTGRKFVLFEKDKTYFATIEKRIENHGRQLTMNSRHSKEQS